MPPWAGIGIDLTLLGGLVISTIAIILNDYVATRGVEAVLVMFSVSSWYVLHVLARFKRRLTIDDDSIGEFGLFICACLSCIHRRKQSRKTRANQYPAR